MKRKYLIISGEKNFLQYKFENNNISLIHEKTIFESKGFASLNNKKSIKFIFNDNSNIYEFFADMGKSYYFKY